MTSTRKIPADPVGFIRECVAAARILWTYHVNMRMRERSISRAHVLQTCQTFEVIEAYPQDKYLPGYLVFYEAGGLVFHVVFAIDVEERNVRVVTAYRPRTEKWGPSLKERRSQ